MSSKKLSDRIIESAAELKRLHISHPLVAKLFLSGNTDGRDGKEVVSRILKYYLAMEKQVMAVYETTAKSAETEEEKQFLQMAAKSAKEFLNNYKISYEKTFGAMDKSLIDEPLPQSIWSYRQLFAESVNQSHVSLLIVMLMTLEPIYEVIRIRDNPGFKPNPYFKWWTNDKEEIEAFLNAMKAFIDSKEVSVSAEEENSLKLLYKRCLIYEIMYYDVCWDKEKYIDFL